MHYRLKSCILVYRMLQLMYFSCAYQQQRVHSPPSAYDLLSRPPSSYNLLKIAASTQAIVHWLHQGSQRPHKLHWLHQGSQRPHKLHWLHQGSQRPHKLHWLHQGSQRPHKLHCSRIPASTQATLAADLPSLKTTCVHLTNTETHHWHIHSTQNTHLSRRSSAGNSIRGHMRYTEKPPAAAAHILLKGISLNSPHTHTPTHTLTYHATPTSHTHTHTHTKHTHTHTKPHRSLAHTHAHKHAHLVSRIYL